ncbi:MAG: PulJ/GspJ family protein [Planctomycetota bacterium]|jgi:type II secretory pathway component PulJ
MRRTSKTSRDLLGFSLAEVLAALTIGAMVLVATLSIYNRAERSAAAITRKLDSYRLPCEVLQRISEDLDEVFAAGSDTKITIENKLDHLYPTSRLTILKTIYDSKNNKQTFERIVWQSSYDYDNDTDSLVLYRGHSGIGVEDKLLDENKESWERELFVPVCTGVTFFKIQVPIGEDFQDKWTSSALPHGIVATISFAEPFKTLTGTLDVPDTEKITRTIAVDRTRKIKFTFAKKEDEESEKDKREDKEDIEQSNE